jgi:hypothetical protein
MVESINDDLEKGLGAGVAAVAEPSAAAFSPRSFPCWHILRVSASSLNDSDLSLHDGDQNLQLVN